jgi:hypothetical protein
MRGKHRRARTVRAAVVVTALSAVTAATALQVTTQSPASAFKPYTHIKTGETAYQDVVDDGRVSITDLRGVTRTYPVQAAVVDALRKWPSHYNSGVIGPDGFPDLVMGQSVIHPENTGLWLRHVMERAWAAQSDGTYSVDERGQALAFAYGYLTHASGDLWMHTLINEFAEGVFPGVRELLDDPSTAAVALRHLVAEGYVGDATVGFDGNPGRELVGTTFSDDSTPHIQFDAPLTFIQRALVSRERRNGAGHLERRPDGSTIANGPAQDRGKLLDFFYGLHAGLSAAVSDDPQPVAAALSRYQGLKASFDALLDPADCWPEHANRDDDGDGVADDGCGGGDDGATEDVDESDPDALGRGENESGGCSFGAGLVGLASAGDFTQDLVLCPAGLVALGIEVTVKTADALLTLITQSLAAALDAVVDAYLNEWKLDIERGLEAWPQLGLALTRGLFDPQVRRDYQDEKCQYDGPDNADHDSLRGECEDGVGQVGTVLHAAKPFITDHLLGMLGLPDAVGGAVEVLSAIGDAIDSVLGPAFNPARMALHQVQEFAEDKVKEELSRRYGIDVDQITDFLGSPSSKMDVGTFTLQLPVVGPVSAKLFDNTGDADDPETDHQKLDRYLGITDPDHHHGPGGGLDDDVAFDPEAFAAYRNTVVLNKVLLLDGEQTDRLMQDLSGGKHYRLYADDPQGNVMLTPLPGVPGDQLNPPVGTWGKVGGHRLQWLRLIDGDHAWRKTGAPTFASYPSGGEGNFPLWESCVLRDRAFRTLFRDWESDGYAGGVVMPPNPVRDGVISPAENFPAYGDATSQDPNDPSAPTSRVVIGTPQVAGTDADGTAFTYVSGATAVTLETKDAFWKAPDIRTSVVLSGAGLPTPRVLTGLVDGSAIPLTGLPDGRYTITTRASDPCGAEDEHATELFVDNTPPVTTFSTPVPGATYDTDDVTTVDYAVVDAGSGVATHSATFDGAPSAQGAVVDAFFLQPGLHSVVVQAADRLGNAGSTTSQFRVRATSVSLRNNLDRAWQLGLVTDKGLYNGASAVLDAAVASHGRGQHATEHQQLGSYVNMLTTKSGRGVDPATAARFTAYVQDLVLSGG